MENVKVERTTLAISKRYKYEEINFVNQHETYKILRFLGSNFK